MDIFANFPYFCKDFYTWTVNILLYVFFTIFFAYFYEKIVIFLYIIQYFLFPPHLIFIYKKDFMKQIIRLTEGDLHHMIRNVINEVLDGMNDTEKAYWLMRQRQQRPNTKSRTNTNYVDNFRRKFYNDVYGINTDRNSNPRGDYDYPESWDRDAYRTGDENIDVHGGIGIDDRGNLYAGQSTWGGTIKDRYTDPGMISRNFNYTQSPKEKNGRFYDNDDWSQTQTKDPSSVTMTPNFRNMFNKGRNRYNDLGDKYDRQRQSQQPK